MDEKRTVKMIIEIDLDSGKSQNIRVEGKHKEAREAKTLLEILKAVFD